MQCKVNTKCKYINFVHRTLRIIEIKIQNSCSRNISFKLLRMERNLLQLISSWQQCTVARPCGNLAFNATLLCRHDARKKDFPDMYITK